jgi:hypothetical protein
MNYMYELVILFIIVKKKCAELVNLSKNVLYIIEYVVETSNLFNNFTYVDECR